MRYILADKRKAIAAGFLEVAHRCNDNIMVLNENEVKYSSNMEGNLAERAKALGGEPISQARTFLKVQRSGKNHIDIKINSKRKKK